MNPKAITIFGDLLNHLHMAGRDSISRMFEAADGAAITSAVTALRQTGYEAEVEQLPHSGYVSVKVQRNTSVVASHPCCTCTS